MKSGQGDWKKHDGVDDCNQYQGRYKNDMKHGYGEFRWSTGSVYKGSYEVDKKKGFGEMFWADNSIFRGYWRDSAQCGLGIMIFKDGVRRAGFFDKTIFTSPLVSFDEVLQFESSQPNKMPESFKQELKEYLGQLNDAQQELIRQEFVGKEVGNKPEPEDPTPDNAMLQM